MLDYFHVVESVRLYVPMMTLRFQDVAKFFARNDILEDGTTVTVSLSVQQKKIIYPFRLFSHKSQMVNGTTTYILYCYLDVPRYWTESINTPLNSTASTALQTLCSQCNMTYDGITTNDQQIWIPQNKRRAEFARDIVRHCYIDATSCIQMGVTIDKKMRVLNISDFSKLGVQQSFSNVESSEQAIITDFSMLNKSGFYNATTGYKHEQVRQSFLNTTDNVVRDLTVKKNSRYLSMSATIAQGVVQNKVSFAPIDVGNVHDNYEQARYQNERLSNLFTYGVEFVTPRIVNANIMDVVSCDLSHPGATSVTSISGKYMVTSKVVYIENMNFYQKVEAFRQGTNNTSDSTQV
jgi:hypothetical protein